jgi:hypothetical protein
MTNDNCAFTKEELREFQKRAVSVLKQIEKEIKNEPSITLISNNTEDGTECQIDKITEWLFKRRPEGGNKTN